MTLTCIPGSTPSPAYQLLETSHWPLAESPISSLIYLRHPELIFTLFHLFQVIQHLGFTVYHHTGFLGRFPPHRDWWSCFVNRTPRRAEDTSCAIPRGARRSDAEPYAGASPTHCPPVLHHKVPVHTTPPAGMPSPSPHPPHGVGRWLRLPVGNFLLPSLSSFLFLDYLGKPPLYQAGAGCK